MSEFTAEVWEVLYQAKQPLSMEHIVVEMVKQRCRSEVFTVGAYAHAKWLESDVRDSCWWMIGSGMAEFTPKSEIQLTELGKMRVSKCESSGQTTPKK